MRHAALLLLAAGLALAHAFPGAMRDSSESMETDDKNEGVVLVLPARRNIFEDAVQTDEEEEPTSGFWRPQFRFGDLLPILKAINRIREQAADRFAGHFAQGGLIPWGKIPERANSTSTTKVIGDHSVTINETTYTDGDENGGTIFRVRTVDVKPLNKAVDGPVTETSAEELTTPAPEGAEESREELTTPSRSVETVEDVGNEIPKGNEIYKDQVETLTA